MKKTATFSQQLESHPGLNISLRLFFTILCGYSMAILGASVIEHIPLEMRDEVFTYTLVGGMMLFLGSFVWSYLAKTLFRALCGNLVAGGTFATVLLVLV